MRARKAAIVIGAADCVVAAGVAIALFKSNSDPATKGFDIVGAGVVILLLILTGGPGFLLGLGDRAPRTALALTLAFPVGFILVYISAMIAFLF